MRCLWPYPDFPQARVGLLPGLQGKAGGPAQWQAIGKDPRRGGSLIERVLFESGIPCLSLPQQNLEMGPPFRSPRKNWSPMNIELPHYHKDAPVTCAACGRRVARKSRQQRYCSDRCRDYEKGQRRVRKSFLSTDTRASPNPPFLLNQNNELRGSKSGSSIPLNVLVGYRWPNAIPVDRDVLRKIVRAELGST